jgi:hypothetical protein
MRCSAWPFFSGVVLVNGILFILLIELLQAIGWWPVPASDGAQDATTGLSARVGVRVAPA